MRCDQAVPLVKVSCFNPTVVSKPEYIPIEQVYVPVKRRKGLNAVVVKRIAESILEVGHRLEACKALGEAAIMALIGSVGNF